MKTTLII